MMLIWNYFRWFQSNYLIVRICVIPFVVRRLWSAFFSHLLDSECYCWFQNSSLWWWSRWEKEKIDPRFQIRDELSKCLPQRMAWEIRIPQEKAKRRHGNMSREIEISAEATDGPYEIGKGVVSPRWNVHAAIRSAGRKIAHFPYVTQNYYHASARFRFGRKPDWMPERIILRKSIFSTANIPKI